MVKKTSGTDGRTDEQTALLYQYRALVCRRAIKSEMTLCPSVDIRYYTVFIPARQHPVFCRLLRLSILER